METQDQNELSRLDGRTYLLDFRSDYGLDSLLDRGVRGTWGLARFVQRRNRLAPGAVFLRSGGFACTTFNAFDEAGHPLLARNFDYKDSPCIVVRTAPAGGYRSVAVADANLMLYGNARQSLSSHSVTLTRLLMAPYACMDGINEAGLAAAILEIKAKPTRQRTGKRPITTSVILRAVLDRCATVEEAEAIFRRFDMRDALGCCYHYQLADAAGNSVILEYCKNELYVYRPENRSQWAMNFFLTPGGDNRKAMGYDRETVVRTALETCGGVMDASAAMQVLSDCVLNYRHRLGWPVRTCWSAVYDCAQPGMLLCTGENYGRTYRFSVSEQ